jgi:hypothetical protein
MTINNKHIVILSLACFIISLNQAVFFHSPDTREYTKGWEIFVIGWFGILKGNLISIGWLANPMLIFSWFNFKKYKISLKYSSLSLLFCLFFIIYDLFENEIQFSNYNEGFYFWISSILIMVLGNLYLIIRKIKKTDQYPREG